MAARTILDDVESQCCRQCKRCSKFIPDHQEDVLCVRCVRTLQAEPVPICIPTPKKGDS
jgi:hypothetical protein